MNVTINGHIVSLEERTSLATLLAMREIKPSGIATAINGRVVAAALRETTTLKDGDKITVIKAFYGG
ncbi:MAG: sulfur carrier protein ThiS [Lachnoclostridium sp.]|nr:sulfur carrier protein ThiS [Lachnoclostridium sp.]